MAQRKLDQQFWDVVGPIENEISPKDIRIDKASHDPRTLELSGILLEGTQIDDDLMMQRSQEIAADYGLDIQEVDDAVALSAALYLENNAQVSTKTDQEMEE